MQNYQSITLDVNNCVEYKYINAKQGDVDSRFLKITLTENGKKIVPAKRSTASFRCLKPDGRICVNKAVINADGTITVTLTEQVLASAGTVRADISLLDGKTVLSSATFFIMVESCPVTEGNVLSLDEFLILVDTTKEAEAAINSIGDIADNVQTAFSRIEDVKAYIGYTSSDILGLQVDYENKQFTRLAGAVGLNAGDDFDPFSIYGGMRRCNVNDNGEITAYYGDSDYNEDGTNGQVMVYIPKFYYKVVPLKLEKIEDSPGYHIRKANYYIADTPKAGFKLHPAFYNEQGKEIDYFLHSAYEGSLYRTTEKAYYNDAVDTATNFNANDLMCSEADRKPIMNQHIKITRANAEKLCVNRGAGWHCKTLKALSAIQFLMIIEFGTMNMQSTAYNGICGNGKSYDLNYSATTGSTQSLGNKSGTAAQTTFQYYDAKTEKVVTEIKTDYSSLAMSYRGIENPWGNTIKLIQGINKYGDGNMKGGQCYICDDYNFEENKKDENYSPIGFYNPLDTAYISAFGYGNEKYDWVFMSSENNGTSALPVGDKSGNDAANLNGYRIMANGGAYISGPGAGMFSSNTAKGTANVGADNGFRMIYVPQN